MTAELFPKCIHDLATQELSIAGITEDPLVSTIVQREAELRDVEGQSSSLAAELDALFLGTLSRVVVPPGQGVDEFVEGKAVEEMTEIAFADLSRRRPDTAKRLLEWAEVQLGSEWRAFQVPCAPAPLCLCAIHSAVATVRSRRSYAPRTGLCSEITTRASHARDDARDAHNTRKQRFERHAPLVVPRVTGDPPK